MIAKLLVPCLGLVFFASVAIAQDPERSDSEFRTRVGNERPALTVRQAITAAEISMSTGQTRRAIDILRAGHDAYPEEQDICVRLSDAYILNGSYNDALDAISPLVQQESNMMQKQEEFGKRFPGVIPFVRHSPRPDVMLRSALVAAHRGALDSEQLDYCRRFLSENEPLSKMENGVPPWEHYTVVEALVALAIARHESMFGNDAMQAVYYRLALRLDPGNAFAAYRLGVTALKAKNYPEAIFDFRTAIRTAEGDFRKSVQSLLAKARRSADSSRK